METNHKISAEFGTAPVTTGSGAKNFASHAYAFEAWEDTVIASFRDKDGATVVTGWEGVLIDKWAVVAFKKTISSFTVTSGGRGQVYNAK